MESVQCAVIFMATGTGTPARPMPMKNAPTRHLIKVEILEAHGLDVASGAKALRVTRS